MKPREFWIIDEYPHSTWVSSVPLNSADTNEEIHVREVIPGEDEAVQALVEAIETTQTFFDYEDKNVAIANLKEIFKALAKYRAWKGEK